MVALILSVAAGTTAIAMRSYLSGQPGTRYENAAKSFPVLQALAQDGVTFLRVQDWCRAFADSRERRTNELAGTCTLGEGFQMFDDASEKRFDELRGKLDDLPYDVMWLSLEYGSGGEIERAELAIDTINPFRRDSLAYDPGYGLSGDMPGERVHHRIDGDWYYVQEDWN
jgi:hypothetical protein